MRLYSMHKREFVMIFIAFFGCFGLAMFIGLAGKVFLIIYNCCRAKKNKILKFFNGGSF